MKEKLEKIKEEAIKQIAASDALEKLNDVRVNYLGKKDVQRYRDIVEKLGLRK